MEEDQAALRDDRAAEALADVLLPDDGRAAGWPLGGQIAAGIDPVAGGAEELRPVLCKGAGGQPG